MASGKIATKYIKTIPVYVPLSGGGDGSHRNSGFLAFSEDDGGGQTTAANAGADAHRVNARVLDANRVKTCFKSR